MFFKRDKVRVLSLGEKLDELKGKGFTVKAGQNGRSFLQRGGFAATVHEGQDGKPVIDESGLAIHDEVAVLTDLGYQKIFLTASGRKTPALAEHLKSLHDFAEDLREELGLTSLYNEGLGTTNGRHLYDRVEDRDTGVPRRPWEKN
jgi:hypothetical protein